MGSTTAINKGYRQNFLLTIFPSGMGPCRRQAMVAGSKYQCLVAVIDYRC
jgi:hypothetical protein